MTNIVIIDSGVNSKHPMLKGCNLETYELKNHRLVKGGNDIYGHGTAITGIIYRSAPNVKITMIKLNGIETSVDEDDLIEILKLLSTKDNIDVINLSLGCCVINNYKKFYDVCQKLSDDGVIIVSAFDNTGSISYPAAFDNVIGVVSDTSCTKTNQFCYIEDNILNLAAKGSVQRVAWTTPEYLLIGGNSFACAHVTGQVAKFVNDGIHTRTQILDAFKEKSIKKYEADTNMKKTQMNFNIRRAALFPFNKEMHSIVRFVDNLSFNISVIYDSKYSATIGTSTTFLMKDNTIKEFIIQNIESINWDLFDTLILGHTDELSSLIDRTNIKKNLINEALDKGKQIYCFDDLEADGYQIDNNIYYPKICERDLPQNRLGMLYRISKPVLGVFGTSSRQGKFTLQIKLRELLSSQGYNVGQIGTEPSSLLFGMDYVFPIGYNSSVYIKGYDTVRYLNYIINDLCMQNKDIIIVGSQSGTVTYDTGNLKQYTITQGDFLLGTQPDAVVLCVNPYDEIEYIKRTINFIESHVISKVIAIVVFPMNIRNDWEGIYGAKKSLTDEEYTNLRHDFEKVFDVPVLKLGEEDDMAMLIKTIIDFF